MSDPRAEYAHAVSVEGLKFGYIAGEEVLSIDALAIEPKKRVFLYGPSGCGKSTLLSMIGGVLVPGEGRVSVLDQDLSAMKGSARDRVRADHLGIIFQQFNLVPYLSVVENVCLPCRYSQRRLKRAESDDGAVEASAARLLSELGIDERLRARRSTDLSVGQQQRVAAARALIGRPELIIADEPTSSLDADRRRDFVSLLLAECESADSTVIFVSHDQSLASHFDEAIDLRDINRTERHPDAA
ncbi:MAG: ABC transporter ATP-binding protein [Woeseiaceae bacterium]|nr:ABC transporter ATP-binding protein [Woeseiaceae bacterium]